MILGGGELKLRGGNPPFPRVLYEALYSVPSLMNKRRSQIVAALE